MIASYYKNSHKMRSNGFCLKKNKVFKRKYLGPSSHLHIKFYWHCWWMGKLVRDCVLVTTLVALTAWPERLWEKWQDLGGVAWASKCVTSSQESFILSGEKKKLSTQCLSDEKCSCLKSPQNNSGSYSTRAAVHRPVEVQTARKRGKLIGW